MKPGTLILIIVFLIMVLIFCLRSCEEEDYFEDTKIENSTDTIVETIPEFPYGKPIRDYEVPEKEIPVKEIVSEWPDSIYKSVEGYPFLNDIQKKVIIEVNKCRTNPSRYADEVIVPFLHSIRSDNIYVDKNGLNIKMHEGKTAVEEAISALRNLQPVGILKPKEYLCKAALDHCKDLGPKGYAGHGGSDDSDPMTRVKRYNSKSGGIGENIDYGSNTAEEIVRNLIVDDGVNPRGHRENLYYNYKYIGVGFGKHSTMRYMCVMDFEM